MLKESRKSIASEFKRCGKYNCAQAVICTYRDMAGLDEETAMHIGNAFAAGMGNMEGTCGAIIGAGVIVGMLSKDKTTSMQAMRRIISNFKQRNGATQCKQLKGIDNGNILRECPDCVADAAEFLEAEINGML